MPSSGPVLYAPADDPSRCPYRLLRRMLLGCFPGSEARSNVVSTNLALYVIVPGGSSNCKLPHDFYQLVRLCVLMMIVLACPQRVGAMFSPSALNAFSNLRVPLMLMFGPELYTL